MTWRQSFGHERSVLRPKCTGTEGAQPQLLLYSTLCFSVVIFVSSVPMARFYLT